MKYAMIAFLACIIYFVGISCSPVRFTQNSSQCSVSSPCVMANGLSQVNQTFNFSNSNRVDILIVDDNSGSMTTEQQNMATPVNGFINSLNAKGLDWQIAITNTDVCPQPDAPAGYCPGPSNVPGAQGTFMGPLGSNPRYGNQYIITPNTPNASNVFYNTIQRGSEVGSGDERGIYAANMAIDGQNTSSAGFFRSNSNLAVVILSDEDERSVGGDCSAPYGTPPGYTNTGCDPGYATLDTYDLPQTLIDKVSSTWNGTKNLAVYSVIVVPNDTTPYPDPNDNGQSQTCLNLQSHQEPYYTTHPGSTYQTLSQMTGGIVGSICDNGQGAFANLLSQITGDIYQQTVGNTITLAYAPASQPTVSFSPSGNAVPWTWAPGSNQIVLSTHPANGTTVNVNYSITSTQQSHFQKRYSPRNLGTPLQISVGTPLG